nr:hypothetical protein [Phocaeicola plebeius]
MTEKVEMKVCEETVTDLMENKENVTLTRKNAYRVKKIRKTRDGR